MAGNSNTVRGSFQTDPISALGLSSPVSIGTDATVGEALEAVQREGQGYVLVLHGDKPAGIMSDREVMTRIVARNVTYGANVMGFASDVPAVMTEREPIARAIKLMVYEGIENIPIVDEDGRATAVLRTLDVIHFLAEAFPEQILNLPPRPHQTMPKPEGA